MPDGFRVAKGYIEVDPDMTGFADKVKAELDREENHAKVKLDLDADGFREKLHAVLDGEESKVKVKMDIEEAANKVRMDAEKLRSDLESTFEDVGINLGGDLSKGIGSGVESGAGGGDSGGGGGIMGVLKGTVITGLIAWGVSLLPAIVPTVFGGFFGAAGAYIAVEGNAKLKASLGRVMTNLKGQIEKDAQVFTPVIYKLTEQFGNVFKTLNPELKNTFSDSIPYLEMFVHTLENMALIVLPPLNQMLKEFTPYLPQMQRGFTYLAQGLGAFMHNLGPGMKSSAEIFATSMKIIGGILAGLGTAAALTANGIMESSHDIRVAWDWVTHTFVISRHDIADVFNGIRHDIANDVDQIKAHVQNVFASMWNNTIGEFTNRSSTVQQLQVRFGHNIEADWNDFTHTILHYWDLFWNNTIGEFTQSSSSVRSMLRRWGSGLIGDWNSFTGTIHRDWNSFWGTIESDARGAVSKVSSIIKGIENAFEIPIHFAEHDVWDPMANVWNKIAGTLHLSKLPTYAVGGLIPGGYSGPPRDEQIIRVSGGESVLNQGATSALGAPAIGALNRMFAYPGAQSDATHFAAGSFNPIKAAEGVAKGVFNAGRDIIGGAVDIAKFMANPLGVLNGLVKDVGGGPVGALMTALIKQVPQAIVNTLLGSLTSMGGSVGGVGGNVGSYAGIIRTVLAMLGEPTSLVNAVEHRMQQESGGNATVVNRWDSNWAAGTPSVGLMQVIGPTFDAWAGPFRNTGPFEYGVSVNPMANIYAGLNYAKHDYPSLAGAMLQAGGYASGGRPAAGEFAVVGEQGPELVQFGSGATVYSNKASGQIINDQSKGPLIGNFTIVQQEVGTTAEAMNALTYTLRNAALTANSARGR